MTPTIGWIMTFVALAAITAFVVSRRRGSPPSGFKPTPRESVEVKVKCDANSFSLVVDPWHVYVRRERPLKWVLDGPAGSTMEIKPQDATKWPLGATLPLPQATPNKPTINAGNVNKNATVGSTHKYSILIECGGRTFDIDPDIYIFD